jgi:hypothetical protein
MRKAARKIRSQRKERRLVEERKKQEEYDARIASDLSEKYVLLIEESLKT